jgi:hypothetical protein
MWRFLLAGLSTIGGVALLFLASFSDTATTWLDARTDAPASLVPVSDDTAPPEAMPAVTAAAVRGGTVQQAALEVDEAEPPVTAARITPPVYHGPVSFALPWRPASEPVRRVRAPEPRPAPVRFFAALRRDVSALFHPSPR